MPSPAPSFGSPPFSSSTRTSRLFSRPPVGPRDSIREWNASVERDLCARAGRGDAQALRALLDHFAGPLHDAVVLPRVGSRAEAAEVLEDTLSRAAERIADFRWDEARGLWPWLRRIAVHRIVDGVRRRGAERRMTERYEAELTALPPRIEAGAEAEIIEAEERRAREQRLTVALATLNERYRRAIELRMFEERPREECAAALGVSVATFDVVLHRAMTSLKKSFGAES
jgi:RNA polymerase sigma-70 factor (ECF subfamily)